MFKKLIVLSIFLIALVACAPDPRNQADADNSRVLTTQEAANQVQQRQLAQTTYVEKLAAFKETWRAAFPTIAVCVQVVTVALSISLSLAMVGTGGGIGYAGFNLGKIAVFAARIKAGLIPLDRKTRTFPLYIQHIEANKFTLHNANTGSVVYLDCDRKEHRELVSAVSEIQRIGVLAYETGQAKGGNIAIGTRAVIEQFEKMVNRKEHAHVSTGD